MVAFWVMPPKLGVFLTGSSMWEDPRYVHDMMNKLEEKTDTAKSDIDRLKGHVLTLTKYTSENRNCVENLERHIKQQVAESLKTWQAHLDNQFAAFTEKMNLWQASLQRSVTDTCTHLKTELETVRSNGLKAVESMKTSFEVEAQQFAKRGNSLEAFARAHFSRLDQRMEAMDGLVQQSAEMLQDVKKRQEAVHKIQKHHKQEGPLTQLLVQGTDYVVSAADVRCRSLQALDAASHRSVSEERDNISKQIRNAQVFAQSVRGRSLESRMRAAKCMAHSRSTSRHNSKP